MRLSNDDIANLDVNGWALLFKKIGSSTKNAFMISFFSLVLIFCFCQKMSLPFEILHEIFIKLHQKGKLECMLVCRHWKSVMEQGTLYDTVCLYSKDGLEKLIFNLSSSPAMANSVNRLLLFLYHGTVINLSPLLMSLPKVQRLFSAEHITTGFVIDQDTAFPFYNQIQHLSKDFSDGIAHKMHQLHSCNNLTILQIAGFDHDIVSLLKNAPNLLSLSLTKLKFCISQINRLMNIDLVDLNQNGWDPLSKKLGHQLETFGLDGNTFEQQISLLDASGCRIKHMTINCETNTILSRLAASNQTSCLQILVLEAMNSGSLLALTEFGLKLDANSTHRKDYAVSFPNILKYAPPHSNPYLSVILY
jgi:hypothetical protein